MDEITKPKRRIPTPRAILRGILRLWLRPEWINHETEVPDDARGVYIANFTSWIDPLVFATLLSRELRDAAVPFKIAMNVRHKDKRVMKLCRMVAPVIFYDPAKADAEINQHLVEAMSGDEAVILFPESRPTNTGALLPVNEVLAGLLAQANPTLYPFYLEGMSSSRFAADEPKQCRKRWLPKLTIHRFQSVQLALPETLKGRARTRKAAGQLHDLLSAMAYAQFDYQRTIFESIIAAAKKHGYRHKIIEDVERNPLSYRKVLIASYALGRAIINALDEDEEHVGLLMPNVTGGLLCFLGLQAYGRVPAILNFTTGRANMVSACKTAGLKSVVTAKRFIKAAELEDAVAAMEAEGINMIYAENLRKKINPLMKLKAIWLSLRGVRGYEKVNEDHPAAFDADGPAVVLFTSGSEGAPKGVVLTHANLMTNMAQLHSRIDFGIADTMFNPLPLFHTSGLTGGIILPLTSGMKTFLYPSPLHYSTIPELIADVDATVLFATDTFLAGYGRNARPHDLHRLRYVFAGAEKLKEETRRFWAEKFGVRVLEGYGVTETAPVLAFNTPIHCKSGSVGRLAPGILHKLEPVEGIEEGGRLVVQAGNVMAGYLLPDNPNTLVPPKNGWHDTGDIVDIDEEGFVTILGRAKRFAKIAGEMVSLAAVEQIVCRIWEEHDHAVVAINDPRKGEQLVLVTTCQEAEREIIVKSFKDEGASEIGLPKHIIKTEELPVLGSGKVDYPAVTRLIKDKL